jgi:hypothetical protein
MSTRQIHIEIYLASHMLQREQGTFSVIELVDRVGQEFGDDRPGVQTHASAHCVANAPLNTTYINNYLWRLDHGRYRCFDPTRDMPHPDRVGGRTHPYQMFHPSTAGCSSQRSPTPKPFNQSPLSPGILTVPNGAFRSVCSSRCLNSLKADFGSSSDLDAPALSRKPALPKSSTSVSPCATSSRRTTTSAEASRAWKTNSSLTTIVSSVCPRISE